MIIRVIDLETTGLGPDAKVVEWATVDLRILGDKQWERGRMAGSLVDPGIPIPPEASAVHHITDDNITPDVPTWVDQIKVVTGPPVPDIWCAHNNRFDNQFFNPAGSKWIDTYRCGLFYWPECPSHSNQCMRYWLKIKLASDQEPHRAPGDAYVTAAILRRLLSIGVSVEDMLAISSSPAFLPRFTFGTHAMKPIGQVPDSYLEWVLSPKGITDNSDVRHTAFTEMTRRRSA